jgi:hypothetical protein
MELSTAHTVIAVAAYAVIAVRRWWVDREFKQKQDEMGRSIIDLREKVAQLRAEEDQRAADFARLKEENPLMWLAIQNKKSA